MRGSRSYDSRMRETWAADVIPVEITEMPSSGWTAVSVFTLVISCLALALSYVTWRRSGSVVKATGSLIETPQDMMYPVKFQVVMRNAGRVETHVVEIWFRSGIRRCRLMNRYFELPVVLPPGAEDFRRCSAHQIAGQIGREGGNLTSRSVPYLRTGHTLTKIRMSRKDRKKWRVFLESYSRAE